MATPTRTSKVTFQIQDDIGNDPTGIARKVVNIDGIPLLPRRGMFINDSNVEAKAEVGNKLEVSKSDSESLDNKMVNATYAASLQSGILESLDREKGVDVVLTRESVKTVHDKLAFTLYDKL
ncbi:hypothetical protein QVD17_24309 [Tagetes erecta]|uniref:Uncharacterized protein n=1 Tax=Tagetes erecta TaxID=13708 RepID=A0AAD8KLF2_TARER|nr:hypothetical protein QVD17_24309 [Tagetes erecta]